MDKNEKIEAFKKAKEEFNRWKNECDKLSKPETYDTGRMRRIYDLIKRANENIDSVSADVRKQFIYLSLYIYAPATLAGAKAPRSIRMRIAETIGCHPAFVSHNIENSVFLYRKYRDFKEGVDIAYHNWEKIRETN